MSLSKRLQGSLSILSVGRLADPREHEHAKCANLDNTEAEEERMGSLRKQIWFLKANSSDSYFGRNNSSQEKLKPWGKERIVVVL